MESADGLAAPQENERFGESVAFGNLHPFGRVRDELVIGSPGRNVNGKLAAGMITVMFEGGSSAPKQFTQDSAGSVGVAESGDNFGWSIATGDFDGDLGSELAVSTLKEDAGSPVVTDVGMVIVMELDAESRSFLRADITSLGLQNVAGSMLGWALASGDFDQDGLDDLGVGAPFGATYGRAYVLYGYEDALLSSLRAQELDTCGSCAGNSSYGYALVSGHFGAHPAAGLAIGSPQRDDGSDIDLGATTVHYSDALFHDDFE